MSGRGPAAMVGTDRSRDNVVPAVASARAGRGAVAVAALVLVLSAAWAYHNSLGGGFVFDDWPTIKENDSIRHWSGLRELLLPSTQHTTAGRPLANLSLALNYAISGEKVWSYHALNLLIHALAGLALFGFARRTFELPRLRDRFGDAAVPLGFVIALLWTLHPLQTESVTYIVQRTEALMGLFYLLTFYALARGVTEPEKRRWDVLAVAACWAGMWSKEVMVTAPVMAVFYHRAFVTGSWAETWRRRGRLLLMLAAGWVLLGIALASTGGNRGGSVGMGVGVGFLDYWLTQPRALVTYLRLALWPHPLVFEYGTEWITRMDQVLPHALVVLPLIALVTVGVWRWSRAAFPGIWFFGILAPTSLTPGVNQMIVEHRMYLSLAAVVAALVVATFLAFGRRGLWIWLPVAAVLGIATTQRNDAYRDVVTLWSDTVAKRPDNALAKRILADFLWQDEGNAVRRERIPEALRHYEASLRLAPASPTTHENYGAVLLLLGDVQGALQHSREALRYGGDRYLAHYNLGLTYAGLGRLDDAIQEFDTVRRLNPAYLNALKNLANALADSGRPEAAIPRYEEALAVKPADPETLYNLGNALFHVGRYAEAVQRYSAALRGTPDDQDVHQNLGTTLAKLGRNGEAFAHFERAAQLRATPVRTSNHREAPPIHRAR